MYLGHLIPWWTYARDVVLFFWLPNIKQHEYEYRLYYVINTNHSQLYVDNTILVGYEIEKYMCFLWCNDFVKLSSPVPWGLISAMSVWGLFPGECSAAIWDILNTWHWWSGGIYSSIEPASSSMMTVTYRREIGLCNCMIVLVLYCPFTLSYCLYQFALWPWMLATKLISYVPLFSGVYHYQCTGDLSNITFILDKCRRSAAMVTPV